MIFHLRYLQWSLFLIGLKVHLVAVIIAKFSIIALSYAIFLSGNFVELFLAVAFSDAVSQVCIL